MYRLIEGPNQEPVTLNEAKSWAKVDINDDDALITALISQSRIFVEEQTNRALFTQTWDLTLDDMPPIVTFRITPVASILGVYYYDIDGQEWTEPSTNYILDSDRLILRQEKYYEGIDYARAYGGWRIRFIGGDTSYPDWSKELVNRLVAHRYDNRGSQISTELAKEVQRHKVRYI